MAQPALKERYITPERYLDLEEKAETKSEYWYGRIYAMSGATPEHVLITGNVGYALKAATRSRPCYVFAVDLKVSLYDDGPYVYPDLAVVYGTPRYVGKKRKILANPGLIVEVLSDSTEAHDRGAKAAGFRAIESVREYVLIAQDRVSIEVQGRQPDGSWNMRELTDPHGAIRLESIDVELRAQDVYELVVLPEHPAIRLKASDEEAE